MIYLFIELESTISRKWVKRSHGHQISIYRRPIYQKRDEVPNNLCLLLVYHSKSLEIFLLYKAKLFRYDKTIQLTEIFDLSIYFNVDLPIDFNYLQNKSVDYIKISVSL